MTYGKFDNAMTASNIIDLMHLDDFFVIEKSFCIIS